jgi:hypothetical protein
MLRNCIGNVSGTKWENFFLPGIILTVEQSIINGRMIGDFPAGLKTMQIIGLPGNRHITQNRDSLR